MATYICTVEGVRGRTMYLYDTKVEIKTEVTVGSVITGNATDGEKTIFLKDVVGVQFKRSSLAIGYLQFETPSMQMNNRGDNMFSENTFTFEDHGEGMNHAMEMLKDFVVDRIEGYKYGGIQPVEACISDKLLSALRRAGIDTNSAFLTGVEKERAQAAALEAQRLQAEKEAHIAARKAEISAMGNDAPIEVFLAEAELCSRIAEVAELWKAKALPQSALHTDIGAKIAEYQKMERMYGKGAVTVAKLLADIRALLQA